MQSTIFWCLVLVLFLLLLKYVSTLICPPDYLKQNYGVVGTTDDDNAVISPKHDLDKLTSLLRCASTPNI